MKEFYFFAYLCYADFYLTVDKTFNYQKINLHVYMYPHTSDKSFVFFLFFFFKCAVQIWQKEQSLLNILNVEELAME